MSTLSTLSAPSPFPPLLHPNALRHLAVLSAVCVLTACGGGSDAKNGDDAVGVVPAPPAASSPNSGGSGATPAPPLSPAPVTVGFTATDAEFANPERGFYRWAWTHLELLSAADARQAYADGYRLVYAMVNLSDWRGSDLPASLLTQLNTAFANARGAGIKLVIRAVYNYPDGETEYQNAQDAPLSRVESHIAQLKPTLQANADVIAFVQAGFIGAWGEWHTSSNQLTTQANRTRVRDALLDAVPSSRFIQVRYPPYVMDWTATLPTLSTALAGNYRVGVHNDCFLASATDVGTYDSNASRQAAQRDYTDRLGDLAPFGGETCNPADESGAVPRTSCVDILAEGARYNLTYLNNEYHTQLFHDRWQQNGCMPEVKRRMGYRLELLSASHATSGTRGQALSVTLTLRNNGWARVFNPRGVQLVLSDAAGTTVRRLTASGADPRAWLPAAESSATLNATIPADLPAGTYQVWLALPDADSRIATDARYAIRPANADNTPSGQRWDATLGAFALGSTIQVK